jgi:hypothetical protein
MKFNKPLYYCTECKTILSSLDKLLFIEEKSTKGFCSETCIEDFYIPLIRHFENSELTIRKNLGIEKEEEEINFNISDNQLVDEVVSSADEVWKVSNELDEEIFTYIKHYGDFSGVVICKVYNGEASFIFLSTTTKSRQLVAEMRAGEKISAIDPGSEKEEFSEEFSDEDYNFMQLLENKKSILLAELLVKRKDDDIPFEDFMLYESCFPEVLETPDEVFESRDKEGDSFFVYIKSFIRGNNNFFYIISCLKRKDKDELPEVNVFPVLAFPTNDMELYSEFRAGKRIAGHLKN